MKRGVRGVAAVGVLIAVGLGWILVAGVTTGRSSHDGKQAIPAYREQPSLAGSADPGPGPGTHDGKGGHGHGDKGKGKGKH